MSKPMQEKIDSAQQAIESLQGPAKAKAEIVKYRKDYQTAVDSAQAFVGRTKLNAPDAQQYITKANGEIVSHLQGIAREGRQFIEKQKGTEEGKEGEVTHSLESLSSNLKASLNQQKEAIGMFKKIEEIDKQQAKAIEDNSKLNGRLKDASGLIKGKEGYIQALEKAKKELPSGGVVDAYSKTVSGNLDSAKTVIQDEIDGLKAFQKDEKKVQAFSKAVAAYAQLVQGYSTQPSPENLKACQDAAAALKPEELSAIFNKLPDKVMNSVAGNFYDDLETNVFTKAESALEKANSSLEDAEKSDLKAEAETALDVVDTAWKTTIAFDWNRYVDMSPKEQEEGDLEGTLMNKLIQTKGLLTKYTSEENAGKLDYATSEKVKAKMAEIDKCIQQVEGFRVSRKNEKDLEGEDPSILKYVEFTVRENYGDKGQSYSFNPEFYKLSPEKQKELKALAEDINSKNPADVSDFEKNGLFKYLSLDMKQGYGFATEEYHSYSPDFYKLPKAEQERIKAVMTRVHEKNLKTVKDQTEQEFLKLMEPEKAMERMKELTGEKGKSYFSGLEKFKAGKGDEAIADFQIYLNQSFTDEEKPYHETMILDAREKIKGLYTIKINDIDSVLRDIKALRYAKAKMRGRPELTFDEGLQADGLEKELQKFREDVAEGKVKDFDARFAQIKEQVRQATKQKTQEVFDRDPKEEDDIIGLLEELHKGIQETDPEKRKAALVKFAEEARYYQAYNLSQKYLDRALKEEYDKYAQSIKREDVLKDMMSDSGFRHNLEAEARRQYMAMIEKDPSLKDMLTPNDVRQRLIDRELDVRHRKAIRRRMTTEAGDDLDSDSALGLYNNWFPLDEAEWYKPWDYGAEEWDEFEMECLKFTWETIATAGIATGASSAGRFGAKAGGKLLLRYLGRQGLKKAEMELIERGGIMALRTAARSGMKGMSYFATRLVSGIALEAGVMYLAGKASQLDQGPGVAVTGESYWEAAAKVSVFRILGAATQFKGLEQAIAGGGVKGFKALMARESLSGIGGMMVDAASAEHHGYNFTGKDAFFSLLNNYILGMGMHYGRSGFEGGPRLSKGDKKMQVAYLTETYGTKVGADFSKPETIQSARFNDAGELVINGKVAKNLSFDNLPKNVQDRVADVAPKGALGQLYLSKFSTEVPAELLPDGDAGRAGEVHGWIDKDGRIHYNLEHLNSGYVAGSEGGPYRRNAKDKILPEGYKASVDADGKFVLTGPDGQSLSMKQFLKTEAGKQSHLMDELKRIKSHEATHQAVEAAYAKMVNGKPVEDPSKTRPVKDMFARPDLDGTVPEGKIPLVDHNGQPMEPTWQNVQEYLCHVGDGSIKVSPEMMKHFEQLIARQVPGFQFSRARQISTKMLASNPKEAFAREHVAADHVGEPWQKIKSVDELAATMKSEKKEQSNFKIAENLMSDFMSVLRSGDPIQIQMFKDNNSAFIDAKVLTQFEKQYHQSVSDLSTKMSTPEGLRQLAQAEAKGEMTFFDRVVSKRLVLEAKMINELTSKTKPDGTPKSAKELASDMRRLRENIDFGAVDINPLALRHLSSTPEGVALIRYGLRHGHMESFASLPKAVQEKLVADTHSRTQREVKKGVDSLQEKIQKTEDKIKEGIKEGHDTDADERKLADMKGRLEAYKRLSMMNKAAFAESFGKVDAQGHPPGFEGMPKMSEVLMANADKLNIDYMAAIIEGKMKYQSMDTGSGKRNVLYIEGRLLGVGGLGEAWSTITFESGSAIPREMVIKRSKVAPDVDMAMDNFNSFDRDLRYDIDTLVDVFMKSGIKVEGGIDVALQEAKKFGLGSHDFNQLNSYLSRLQAAHNEAQNVRLIMEHQAKGEMTTFTKFHYVTPDNVIFMESIAVPKANYQVCDFEKIMTGDVTSLDGKKPISQEQFWGGLADIMDSLGEAHALGFVHRDIKPENFGIGPDGKVRLIDAGSLKTKDAMTKVSYLELPTDPYDLPHQADGRDAYYYPYEGGITLHYYDGSVAYHESKGTIDADGKPKVNFGGSDRFAMARSLEEIIDVQSEAGKPKWASPDKVQKIRGIIDYLQQPRSDIAVAARRLRETMGVQ